MSRLPPADAPESFALPVVSGESPSTLHRARWKSLESLERGYEPVSNSEFPPGTTAPPDGIDRRSLLQLFGSSAAAASVAACTQVPDEKILPYTRQPPEVTPSTPTYYATALSRDGYATPLLAESYEGRPTKIEGNPTAPSSTGATGRLEQAALVSLYDPMRAKVLTHKGKGAAWSLFVKSNSAHMQKLVQEGHGNRVRILCGVTSSPLLSKLRDELLEKIPGARVVELSTSSRDNEAQGARLLFGEPLLPRYVLARANVIAALDSDLLDCDPHGLRASLEFADRRVPSAGPMNRLYAVESRLSVTGAAADHRLSLRSADVASFALLLARELGRMLGHDELSALRDPPALDDRAQAFARALADDLATNRGRSVIAVGPSQPAPVQALGLAMNAALGSLGTLVELTRPAHDAATGTVSLRQLAEECRAGAVDTLVITAWNPVYASPGDIRFDEALARVPNVIYLGQYEDETAAHARWFVPRAHELEHWGDGRAEDGTVLLTQPLIRPLFNGVAECEVWAALVGRGEVSSHALLRDHWRRRLGDSGINDKWDQYLAQGFIPGSAPDPASPGAPSFTALSAALNALADPPPGTELTLYLDPRVHDGRYANNPQLQELPEPISKLTWDNAAYISAATAKRLKVETGQVVTLEHEGTKLDVPVLVLPGQADDSVSLALGYGRTGAAEKIARGVGVNAYRLQKAETPWFFVGLNVHATKRRVKLALTQDHWDMQGRPLALDTKVAELDKLPHELHDLRGKLPTLFDIPESKEGYAWGMSVDLSRCTGCSACVLACQTENNIPVVGKAGVLRGREMHWLRIDRYFAESAESPEVVHQPMMCVHCEAAPCEYVCPVNATVHSEEGLNEMVYNRCVGTRYCANNCPYKVRRFNYLHYTADLAPTERMRQNPDVTVRARGVMEKCTYCVQRIEGARIDARIEGRPVADGEVKTACQQACPTRAIVFGSLHDEKNEVAKLHRDERRYDVLHELGTRPRTAYLVRVRNPNPKLERS